MTRVLIAGGGVGGLEAALALKVAGAGSLDITLVTPDTAFVYRPWSVKAPFDRRGTLEVDLRAVAADRGFALLEAAAVGIDGAARRLRTSSGVLDYDAAVLALGARPEPIVAGALVFRGPQDAGRLAAALDPGRLPDGARVAVVATSSSIWSLPAYELAMLTAKHTADAGRRINVALVVGEPAPLQDFGPDASRAVRAALAERGVELYCGTIPETYENGQLYVPMAGTVPADLVVALPALFGRRLDGLPADSLGFTPVDDYGRVEGLEDVYAVGDMTDRRLKQGGLTTQQADVAAAMIAHRAGLGPEPEPYTPVLRAMLLTGDRPLYLRYPAVEMPSPVGGTDEPWWPPHKIVGLHLGPYLATHGAMVSTPQ